MASRPLLANESLRKKRLSISFFLMSTSVAYLSPSKIASLTGVSGTTILL
jgi:hypothetical protein